MLGIIRRVERYVLVSLLLSMVALFAVSIVVREFGGTLANQFAWIEEAVRLMNLVMVFAALGLALERGRHVSVETLRESLPPRARDVVRKLIDAVGCVFSAYLAYLAWRLAVFVLATGQTSPTLGIPMGWIYMAPVAGFGLLSLRYGLSLVCLINRFEPASNQTDAASRKNNPA